MKLKTVVITGMTSGIGLAVFHHLLSQGHFVIGVGRNQARLDEVAASVLKPHQNKFELIKADFSILSDIENLSDILHQNHPNGIDVLINNAAIVPKPKRITVDQFELQFQVNHLAVVKLSFLLLDLLALKKGTLITTASNAHRMAKYNAKDIQAIKRYSSIKSYGKTKLYNIYFSDAFNDYVGPAHGIYAYAVHPGLVRTEIGTKDTSKLYAWFWKKFTKRGVTPETAVLSYDFLVNQEKRDETYSYYYKGLKEAKSKVAQDIKFRDDLWRQTLDLLNIKNAQSSES
jgi:NAD(P)-dependent dehydrogenase (short-subunit alcohol dehydrogenase family)